MDQWNPAWKDREGESLYGSMFRRVQGAGGRVRGVLWYQGESDANPKGDAPFLQRFEAFVKAVRTGDRSDILSDYADGARTFDVTYATLLSAQRGEVVRIGSGLGGG